MKDKVLVRKPHKIYILPGKENDVVEGLKVVLLSEYITSPTCTLTSSSFAPDTTKHDRNRQLCSMLVTVWFSLILNYCDSVDFPRSHLIKYDIITLQEKIMS